MIFADEIVTLFLGAATLLLISIYTIAACRAQIPRHRQQYSAFLFEGKAKRYSLAGAVGTAFSVTYYGATTIFGHLYKGWCVIFLLTTLVASLILVRKILSAAHSSLPPDSIEGKSNILLDFIEHKMGKEALTTLVNFYSIIYFLLLVEELAVSRLILTAVFPDYPAISAAMLATICLVIIVYLKWGGFKAILISDFEQLKLLFPFVLALIFLIYRNPPANQSLGDLFTPRSPAGGISFLFGGIYLIAWIVGGVDFYSRLNFKHANRASTLAEHKGFASLALALTSGVFIVGALFGMFMPEEFSLSQTPSEFTKRGVEYIAAHGSRATSVIFFASLFCMIFTTINTLLFTLVQLGFYAKSTSLHMNNISRLLLFGVLLSCLLWFDSTSALGLFFGGLMILPFCCILMAIDIWPKLLTPSRLNFLWYAAAIAAIIFFLAYDEIETDYSRHYLIAAIIGGSTILSAILAKQYDWLMGRTK